MFEWGCTTLQSTKEILPLIIDYDARLPEIKSILNRKHHIITQSHSLQYLDRENRLIVAFRNKRNIQQLTTQSALEQDQVQSEIASVAINWSLTVKTRGCNVRGCGVYPSLHLRNTFACTSTERRVSIPHVITCDTHLIIYVLECGVCKLQYVGMTKRSMKERMRRYRNEFANNNWRYRSLLYRHADTHKRFDFSIILLERNTVDEIKRRETYWISRLRTLSPLGLNTKR